MSIAGIQSAVDFHDARAEFVRQLQENLVVIQRLEPFHEKDRIERDGKFLTFVLDGNAFTGLTHLRCVGRDRQIVFGEGQLDGVCFFAGHYFRASQRLQKLLPRQRDPFRRFRRDDPPVVGIVAIHQLGDHDNGTTILGLQTEQRLVLSELYLHIAFGLQEPV